MTGNSEAPQPQLPSETAEPTTTPPNFLAPQEPPGSLHRIFLNEKGLRAGWRLLVFLAIFAACMAILASFAHGLLPSKQLPQFKPQHLVLTEGMLVLSALVAAAIMGAIEKRSFADYALPLRSTLGLKFWQGVVWGWIAMTGLLLLIYYYRGFDFGTLAIGGRRALIFYAGAWAVGFFLVGVFEEFFFRGYALSTLTTGMGFWPSAVLLSVIFGAVHLGNHGENWVGALSAGLVGLFFCFTVRRSRSLWFAIGLHAMWDYSESFIYAVPDSGLMARGHLLNSSFHGPTWLTGGTVGPEGSLFVFIVIANLFIVFHLLYPKARFPRSSS